MGRTSIIVVAFNHRAVLGRCVHALETAGLDPAAVRLILVDNASGDGTAELIRTELLAPAGDRTVRGLPALFLRSDRNLGFAGGCNLGLRRALDDGDDHAYLLNPDTEAEPGFLPAALAVAASDPTIALVQSLILHQTDPQVVNTHGNAVHYLGFGWAAGDGQRLDHPAVAPLVQGPRDIAFASGAGMLIDLACLRRIGLLDEELFLYLEDLELAWRARLAGLRVVLAPGSRVRHAYAFHKGVTKFHFLERNRWLVLLWCYRVRTLLLLLPALLACELGLWALAVRQGWWREKARACTYVLDPRRWPRLIASRQRVQALRRVSDQAITAAFTGAIHFPSVSGWALVRIANPLLATYWWVVRRLIRW
jgi:GT2 family glycosyltransferase